MVDIHTHLLPMVDDGAKTMEDALELLGLAWKDGTRVLILTPHYRGRYKASAAKIPAAFEALQTAAAERYPELALYLGNEVYYEEGVMDLLAQGVIRPMNGSRYVLLEFGDVMLRNQILNGISEVFRHGCIPIIAHLERYSLFQKDPSLVETVLDMGAMIQLNADSVMGKQGFATKRFCHRLLKQGQVHFIASDAHDPVKRSPQMEACRRRILRKYGPELAHALFISNPTAVIHNNIP